MKNNSAVKQTIIIALPIIIQNIITSSLNLADNLMLSRQSEKVVAAAGIANQLFFVLILICFGLASGGGVLISQFYGKKDYSNIRKTLAIVLMLSFIIGLLFSLIAIFAPSFLLSLFIDDISVISEGVKYLKIVGLSFLFTSISFAYSSSLRSVGRAKYAVLVSSIAVFMNIFFNWLLIFGNLGFPKMGIEGAAIATLIARIIEFTLIIYMVYRYNKDISARLKDFYDFNKKLFIRFINVSLPVVTNEFMWSMGIVAYTKAIAFYGASAVAAFTTTRTAVNFIEVGFLGIAIATQVSIGMLIGKGEEEKAEEVSYTFLKIFSIFTILMSIILYFISPFMVSIYNFEQSTLELSLNMLKITSIILIFKNINLLFIVGVSRGGGDTKMSMLIEIIGVWLIGVPLAFISVFLGLDVIALFIFISFEELAKTILVIFRWKSGKWIKNVVKNID